jgi:hypothetical protein
MTVFLQKKKYQTGSKMRIKLVDTDGTSITVKDGHTDVASVKNSIVTIMQHCEMIMAGLEKVDSEAALPTWWTNSIAVSKHEVVSAANFLAADMALNSEGDDKAPSDMTIHEELSHDINIYGDM